MSAQFASASLVPAPECVVMKVRGMRTVLGVAKSQANQESLPARRAASTASSSMMDSRAKLTSTAPGASSSSWSVEIIPTVSAFAGTCKVR